MPPTTFLGKQKQPLIYDMSFTARDSLYHPKTHGPTSNILHRTYGWHPKKEIRVAASPWCFEKKTMIWLRNKREKHLSNLIILFFFQPLTPPVSFKAATSTTTNTHHFPAGKKKRAATSLGARTSMAESMWMRQPLKVLFPVTWDRSGNPPQIRPLDGWFS